MKRKLSLLTLVIFGQLNAQSNSTILEHNNVSAHISDVGTFFRNFTDSTLGYEIPKGSGRHAIYSTQFWFAGADSTGEIHFVQGGAPGLGSDVFNGPISDAATYNTPTYQNAWGSAMWEINQYEIDIFKTWWTACSSYSPSVNLQDCLNAATPTIESLERIDSWPAHGDYTQGQSFYLAPYYDYDGSGYYNPEAGDYPIIKGCSAVYMIQNDAAQSHTYSDTDSIGLEIHTMFYQYQTWDYLNDVTFVDIIAINRSNQDYSDFAHSVVVEANIGNNLDDYYGCDSTSNTMFFYNGDNNDEDALPYLGYGLNPPAIGVVSLDQEMSSCVTYGSNPTVSGKWNLMHGLQNNGADWLDNNLNATNYVFSGNPNVSSEWSALNSAMPVGNAKGISSHNYGTLHSGDTLKQTYAITYARNGTNLENVNNILSISSEIKSFYDSQNTAPCTGAVLGLSENKKDDFSLFPNPSTGKFTIRNNANVELKIRIYNSIGQMVKEVNSNNNTKVLIDLSNQSRGIYTVELISEKGVHNKKVVFE